MRWTTIYDANDLKIEACGLSDRDIRVHVNAPNPIDGKTYLRTAGWLSVTYTLHCFEGTRTYAFDKAIDLLVQFKQEICQAMLSYATGAGQLSFLQQRMKHWNRQTIELTSHRRIKVQSLNTDIWIGKIRTARL